LIGSVLTGCTDAEQAKTFGYGSTYTIKVLGPDTLITYQSSGKVISEEHSNGYYFNDAKTGKLIEVSGIITL
jgi:hypothetical protein